MNERVTESTVNALGRRANRLSELVERATKTSSRREVRDAGRHLVEILGERLEELREMLEGESEDLPERVKAFAVRLRLAEEKVSTWNVPKPRAREEQPRRERPVKRSKGHKSAA